MSTLPAFVIARLTLREASRRRLLLAVAILTVILVGFTAWAFAQLTSLPCRDGRPCSPIETKALAAVLLILVTFMYSFLFSLGAVFVMAPAVAHEVESGVALALLPRPIRRSDLVVGKWLGWSTLVGGYTIATTGLQFIAVDALVGYTPPYPLQAIAFLVGEAFVMLSLALLCSTRLAPMTGGIVALALFGLSWMGGIAHAVGTALGSDPVRNIGFATRLILPADALWRGALFHLEPAILAETPSGISRAFAANPFFALAPPSPAYIAWSVAWIALVLGLAILSFARREI